MELMKADKDIVEKIKLEQKKLKNYGKFTKF